jgi:tRNA(Ile)-lysidine synthase
LFARGEHVMVAVSGGADSVALLLALHELASALEIQLSAAHLHHGIRGAEADGDVLFVRSLARQLGIPLIAGRVDVPALARRKRISIEMAAREARYSFFACAADKARAEVLATAHNADDQVETVLLRLARGTGLRGLGGISPSAVLRGRRVVRPLLTVTRPEIISFLESRAAVWREDSTNRAAVHLRNRVRHKILPALEAELNPDVRAAILRTGLLLRDDESWLDSMARTLYARMRGPDSPPWLDAGPLGALPPAARRRIILLWLSDIGVPSEHIDFNLVERLHGLLLSDGRRKEVVLPGGRIVRLRQNRACLCLARRMAARGARARGIRIPGVTILRAGAVGGAGLTITTRLEAGIVRERGRKAGDLPAAASLAPAALRGRALTVRSWLPGDRMNPFGMRGSRKLQDIWTDAKVPREEREATPVFVCEGEVVWIPGYRVARGWEVRDGQKPALQILVERDRPPRDGGGRIADS